MVPSTVSPAAAPAGMTERNRRATGRRRAVSSTAMASGTMTSDTERTRRPSPKRPAAMSRRRHDHSLAALTPGGTVPIPVAGRLTSGEGGGT